MSRVISLTAAGRSALAGLRVEGPHAVALVEKFFLPAGETQLRDRAVGSVLFGHWSRPDGEEVVVSRPDPSAVEIHCHGGTISQSLLLQSLIAAGCESMPWGDWIRSTYEDPIAAAATRALAEARTLRTALILLDQAQGALRTALETIRQSLRQDDLASAQTGLDNLLASATLGLHLVSGWQVVLAGRTNVGKSSLINALLGYERAIVFDQPGTTRDTLAASTALQGWPVALIDTAGLRKTADPLESAGIQAATAVLEEADLVLLIFDASLPWSAEDDELLERFPDALLVHNKCDLADPLWGVRPTGLKSSAVQEGGVLNLCEQIIRRLVGRPPAACTAVPFTRGQVDLLEQVRAAVAGGNALAALGLLSGLPFFTPGLAGEHQ